MSGTQRPPREGEKCTCGRPATVVFETEEHGDVGYCGIPDGGGSAHLKKMNEGHAVRPDAPLMSGRWELLHTGYQQWDLLNPDGETFAQGQGTMLQLRDGIGGLQVIIDALNNQVELSGHLEALRFLGQQLVDEADGYTVDGSGALGAGLVEWVDAMESSRVR